jgi:GT2 family glycosyltransferase
MLHHPIHLEFQKVDAVYLYVNRPRVTDYHWIYFFDTDIAINRLVEFKNLSPANTPPETTVICAEVTQHHDDVTNKVINDLTRVGLIQKEEILDTKTIREDYAYPIYKRDYEKELKIAETFIKQYDNIHLVGRSAQFTHFEVDDNLEEAVKTIEVISKSIPKSGPKPIKSTAMRIEYDYPMVYAVLLTYNHYEDTEECLRSLLTSEFQDLRVVVVDNASSDMTPEKIRLSLPEVHVIENKQNLGVPAGYNIGFEHALTNGADYILMLNNDTILDSHMISQLLEVAENDPEAGVLMPSVMYYEKKDQIWSSGGHYRSFPPSILLRDKRASINDPVHLIEYAPSCGLLIHRRAFERVGLFDPGYFFWYDDWDFSERVRTHGLHIWSVPYAQMWHKVSRTTQGSQSELFWKTYGTSITRFYRRHGRPVWFSLPIHIGYIALREFIWKRNWKYLPLFWKGIVEGMQKPLGDYQNPAL